MVGRLTLDQEVEVRIPAPQLREKPRSGGVFSLGCAAAMPRRRGSDLADTLSPELLGREAIQLGVVALLVTAAFLLAPSWLQVLAGVLSAFVALACAVALVVAWRNERLEPRSPCMRPQRRCSRCSRWSTSRPSVRFGRKLHARGFASCGSLVLLTHAPPRPPCRACASRRGGCLRALPRDAHERRPDHQAPAAPAALRGPPQRTGEQLRKLFEQRLDQREPE